ncbi:MULTISPECIES: MerR family transcriptional regulator [unclassified Microbacterium]|uniref:MerR family transcriptional regulator n=1 Tax=unclassified Microbacterium TaxID=2609290 RepID=UPI00214B4AC0|nr:MULTISPECIES: MerR family transcriptional regulator [unclassified Microbacterium]MCR2784820.1 MerR family transcriptional regulator [Microbacterium sp. zg.B96]WIM16358.1 MerR family transcriptional regulator [Microbacterium sp. zg-B96]
MKIGELSERTGIPTRMLRYYEQQGLISSRRASNGYRAYDASDVELASRVRALVQSGLSTRMARIVLDIERQSEQGVPASCSIALAEELAEELTAIEERLSCLKRSRDSVARYLDQVRPAQVREVS